MSKRKNRELRNLEAAYRLSKNPHFVAGAAASGVPDATDPYQLYVSALKALSRARGEP